MPFMEMSHEVDPRDAILKTLGDVSAFELFNNQVLVAVYVRPERTRGGIIITESTRGEDVHQGKVGLVIKRGPTAFDPAAEDWFKGVEVHDSDWVVFRPSEGWGISIKGTMCRVLPDTAVRARVSSPDMVW